MPLDLSRFLVVGISSTALFDLKESDRIFDTKGIKAYREHMVSRETTPLEPGTGFAVVKALLSLNQKQPRVEVIVMSRNSPETSVAIMNSVKHHGLDITRFAFAGGEPLADYVKAFGVDLFLSTHPRDVQKVADSKACATALLYPPPSGYLPPEDQVRFAFDADAVLFSEESELTYKREGLEAFHAAEDAARDQPMKDGPFASFLRKLAALKSSFPEGAEYAPVRIAIVTARNAPAQTRVISTLRSWGVYVDQAFFLGGLEKKPVLEACRPHIFFDDQEVHVAPASSVVPAARVPYPSNSPLQTATPSELEDPRSIPLSRSPADRVG